MSRHRPSPPSDPSEQARQAAYEQCRLLAAQAAELAEWLRDAPDPMTAPNVSPHGLSGTVSRIVLEFASVRPRLAVYATPDGRGWTFNRPAADAMPRCVLGVPAPSVTLAKLGDPKRTILVVPDSVPALSAATAVEMARAGRLGLGVVAGDPELPTPPAPPAPPALEHCCG